MTRIDLSATASDSVRRLNPQIFAGKQAQTRENEPGRDFARVAPETPAGADCGGNSGITRQKRMNKTEARAMQWLRFQGYTDLIAQPTRLFPLAGGGSYTPDFLAWEPMTSCVWVVEVKTAGAHYHGWEQGYDRYKRAALQYSQPGSPWRYALLTWHARRREWTFEAW
jgi:hypothetical protein